MHRMRQSDDGDLLALPSAPDDLRASSVSSQSTSSDLSSSSSSSSFYSPSSFVASNLSDKVSSLFSLTAPLSASSSSSLSSASSRFTGSPSPVSDEAELLDGEMDELQHGSEWAAAELVMAGKLPSAALTQQQAQQAAATILSSSSSSSLASSVAAAANNVAQLHHKDGLTSSSVFPSASLLPATATSSSQLAATSTSGHPTTNHASQSTQAAGHPQPSSHATHSSHAAPHSLDDVSSSASSCSSNSSSSSSRAIDHTRIIPAELHGRYTLVRYLGSGSYGHVHVARDSTGKEVAIKKIVNIFDNLTNAKRLLREIKILRMLQHVNVISLREILPPVDPQRFDDLLIVFEFVETDLQKLIHSDQPFSNDHVQYFLYQLLCGVKYIHSGHIIHRDLKPANVLVNSDCSLKICDFGLARSTYDGRAAAAAAAAAQPPLPAQPTLTPTSSAVSSTKPQLNKRASLSSSATVGLQPATALTRELTKHVVTRWYRAPELILLNDKYTTAIDMWSVGCILAELLSMQTQTYKHRMPLFPGRSVSTQHNQRTLTSYPPFHLLS